LPPQTTKPGYGLKNVTVALLKGREAFPKFLALPRNINAYAVIIGENLKKKI